MPDVEFSNPSAPFLEMWAFRVSLTSSPRDQKKPPQAPRQTRSLVTRHLQELAGTPIESESTENQIWKEVREIVTDHLSSPDYRFFVTEFEEHPGSWEIAFVVVGAFYGGVCGYGAFRQGLEYVYSDLKAVFGTIVGLRTTVRKRFKERHVMAKPRIEPTVDWNEPIKS